MVPISNSIVKIGRVITETVNQNVVAFDATYSVFDKDANLTNGPIGGFLFRSQLRIGILFCSCVVCE